MEQSIATQLNTPAALSKSYLKIKRPWLPVLLFLPGRLVFAFLAQALTAGVFTILRSADAWREAASWWPVYSTLTDVFCLLTLAWLTSREKMKLIDLLGVKRNAILKQLAWTPAYLLAVAPTALLAHFITQLTYGSELPPYLKMVDLPLAGAFYSLIIWPVIWVITEELVYLGYLLPRLEALIGKSWLAGLVVSFFWGLQHLAIPFLPDAEFIISRVAAAWAGTAGVVIVFLLWRRRLVPLIGAHYIADLSTAMLISLPTILGK